MGSWHGRWHTGLLSEPSTGRHQRQAPEPVLDQGDHLPPVSMTAAVVAWGAGGGAGLPACQYVPQAADWSQGLPLTCPHLGQVDAQSGKVRVKCHVLQGSGECP